jgi:hypothetical protein
MLDKGDMIDKPFPALYVNPVYILLWVNKKELTEIGKLIGT